MLRINDPVEEQVCDIESAEGQHCLTDNQFPDVMMHMMPQFVCQHHFDLVGCVAIQHRVAYYNAARITQPHQRSIGRRRLAAHLHREDTTHFCMSTLSKG